MKTLLTFLTSFALAAAAPLKPGDAVNPDAIAAADFLKGRAPEAWERGKVYLIVCWSITSTSSVEAIPRINELYTGLRGHGLRVIAVHVWEDDPEKAAGYITLKGDAIAYPVAFAATKSAFSTAWLEAAGVKSVPHVFVVKDGKLLFTAHPAILTREVVAELLAGGDREAAEVGRQTEAAAKLAAAREQQAKEMAAQRQRLGDFSLRLSKLAAEGKHTESLKLVEDTLAKNAKLTPADKQQLMYLKAMILAELKNLDAALDAVDAMKALVPDSPMAKDAENIKLRVRQRAGGGE